MGPMNRSGEKDLREYVWCRIKPDDWARVDAVRGEMPRREWVRNAFFSQLRADEKSGNGKGKLVAGLTRRENPYDGAMPYGLPLPDPYTGIPGRGMMAGGARRFRKGEKTQVDANTELRHIQVLGMRQAGHSWDEIAEATGYSKDRVRAIARKLMDKYKMFAVQDYREWTLRQALELYQVQRRTIDEPGYLSDPQGNIITGPDGLPLIDKAERTKAVTEARKIVESIRREVGTDAPSVRHVTLEKQQLDATVKGLLAQIALSRPAALENIVDGEVVSDSGELSGAQLEDEVAGVDVQEPAAEGVDDQADEDQQDDPGADPEEHP
jgi:hypothetical protein